MRTAEAARAWADVWSHAWPAADAAAIEALYAPMAALISHPFRDPHEPGEYVRWAFATQAEAECRFGQPIVEGEPRGSRVVGRDHVHRRLRRDDRRGLAASLRHAGTCRRAARRVGRGARTPRARGLGATRLTRSSAPASGRCDRPSRRPGGAVVLDQRVKLGRLVEASTSTFPGDSAERSRTCPRRSSPAVTGGGPCVPSRPD